MTVVEHIKHLIVGLTAKEKKELATYLTEPKSVPQKPESLRGDWSSAFSDGEDLDDELKEIRAAWLNEWGTENFVK